MKYLILIFCFISCKKSGVKEMSSGDAQKAIQEYTAKSCIVLNGGTGLNDFPDTLYYYTTDARTTVTGTEKVVFCKTKP